MKIINSPEHHLNDVATTVSMEDIPPELFMNLDQTGTQCIMKRKGIEQCEIVGVDDNAK